MACVQSRKAHAHNPELAFVLYVRCAGLVLGASTEELLDGHISDYLPQLQHQPLNDLFVAGAIGLPPVQGRARHAEAPQRRGLLKKESGDLASSQRAGPLQTMRLQHLNDRDDLLVSIQAVRKTAGNGMFLILHPLAPRAGHPDFW